METVDTRHLPHGGLPLGNKVAPNDLANKGQARP
jgi:hypothetical protein